MIDLRRFKQGLALSLGHKDIKSIDMSVAKEWSVKSVNEVKEYAGTWNAVVENGQLRVEIDNIIGGGVDQVSIPPTGWTWHTHPKGCPSIDNCSVIPPSAQDFALFAERYNDQHMVISKRRIYWVKANRQYSKEEVQDIHDFYKIIEKYFDDTHISHNKFDRIFTLASKFGNFFKIYKFKNKNVTILGGS